MTFVFLKKFPIAIKTPLKNQDLVDQCVNER